MMLCGYFESQFANYECLIWNVWLICWPVSLGVWRQQHRARFRVDWAVVLVGVLTIESVRMPGGRPGGCWMYSGNCVLGKVCRPTSVNPPRQQNLSSFLGRRPAKRQLRRLRFRTSLSPLAPAAARSRTTMHLSAGLGSDSVGLDCANYSHWEMRLLNNYTPAALLRVLHVSTRRRPPLELCASEIAPGGVYFAFTSCTRMISINLWWQNLQQKLVFSFSCYFIQTDKVLFNV